MLELNSRMDGLLGIPAHPEVSMTKVVNSLVLFFKTTLSNAGIKSLFQ